jgi:hypothetical protein
MVAQRLPSKRDKKAGIWVELAILPQLGKGGIVGLVWSKARARARADLATRQAMGQNSTCSLAVARGGDRR